jgi:hypothetical protein
MAYSAKSSTAPRPSCLVDIAICLFVLENFGTVNRDRMDQGFHSGDADDGG